VEKVMARSRFIWATVLTGVAAAALSLVGWKAGWWERLFARPTPQPANPSPPPRPAVPVPAGMVDPYGKIGKEEAGALIDLVPKQQIPAADALAVREYLRAWRGHLAALRAAGRKAGLDKVPADKLDKLEAHPTIALVAELAGDKPVYKALDEEPARPTLTRPELDAGDRETAEALRALLVGSPAGQAFAEHRLELKGRPDLRAVLARFHERAKLVGGQFREELGGGVASRETLAPVSIAVGELTDALKPEGTVKLPTALRPAPDRKGSLLVPPTTAPPTPTVGRRPEYGLA
jgi:hypothetical protein